MNTFSKTAPELVNPAVLGNMALHWNLIFAYIAEVLEWSLKLFGLGSMSTIPYIS